MSNKLAMYALDKIRIVASIPLEVAIKLRKRADERGVSLSNYIGIMLYAHTHNDPWTVEDEKLRKQMILENTQKRKARKAKFDEQKGSK